MRWISLPLVSLAALACHEGQAIRDGAFVTTRPPPTSAPDLSDSSTGAPPAGSTTGEATPPSTSTGGSLVITAESSSTSAGVPPDLGPPGPTGCLGKIDFLFVISNSGWMYGHQQQLLAAFPGFIDAIESHFLDFDTHVMVVDTDKSWRVGDCSLCQEDCNKQGFPPQCGAAVHPCDSAMGAGVTYPAGINATNHRCDLAGGRRYINRDEPDLKAAFQCVAQVGTGGAVKPRTGDAMIEAVSSSLNDPGGCNAGFLRDDALLVVTLIDDGPDDSSVQPTSFWVDALLDAKHGDADAIVVLGITTDMDQPEHICWPEMAQQYFDHPVRELVEALPHGMFESICVESYVPFFESAIDSIVERCEQLIPK